MPSTYTTRSRAEKQAPGENNNSWGALLNANTIDIFDQAMDGMVSFSLSGSKTLSANNGAPDEARCRYVNITGGIGGTLTIPNVEKVYIVRNAGSGTVTFTTGSGTTCTLPAGTQAIVVCEGNNICRSFVMISYDAELAAIAGLASAANQVPVFTGLGTAGLFDFGVWTTSSPTPVAGTGSFTSASASVRYRQMGKLVFIQGVVAITTNGTAATNIQIPLPVSGVNFGTGDSGSSIVSLSMSQSTQATDFACVGKVANAGSSVVIVKYDGTYPGASGHDILFSGVYEGA